MSDDLSALINDFERCFEACGNKRDTARSAARMLKARLLPFLAAKGLKPRELGVREAMEARRQIIENGKANGESLSPVTVNHILGAVKAFYDYLSERGLCDSNPFSEIRRLKEDGKVIENVLSERDLFRLLEKLSDFEGESGPERVRRYKCHIASEVLYSTGLRVGELSRLKQEDVDLDAGTVFVREGKGGKSREAFLNEYAKGVLKLYIQKTRGLVLTKGHRTGSLFGCERDALLSMLNGQLLKECRALGIKKITSHGFRHSLGFHLLRSGCDIRFIQGLLGHERLKNTEIYTKVEKEDLSRVLAAYHPRRLGRQI